MDIPEVFAQYLEHVFAGKRCEARELIEAALDRGIGANRLIQNVIWPAMEQVDRLHRAGRISRLMEHMASRINRMVADQLQAHLARKPKAGNRIIVTCGNGEIEELGAQMMSDLFEAQGWSVWFLGAGVPNDEVLQLVGKVRPDVLCIYGTRPEDLTNVRRLIDTVRQINACDQMQVLVAGGVFNRAGGLEDELHADLHAPNAIEAVKVVQGNPLRIPKPDLPQPGRRRKKKRPVPNQAVVAAS